MRLAVTWPGYTCADMEFCCLLRSIVPMQEGFALDMKMCGIVFVKLFTNAPVVGWTD